MSYSERRAEEKKRDLAKKKAVDSVSKALEGLWKLCLDEKGGFSDSEAQAVADASQKLRSIQGGWVNRRSRR